MKETKKKLEAICMEQENIKSDTEYLKKKTRKL